MSPIAGRVQVSNANVYDIDGIDYRRQGTGTAIYDVIERISIGSVRGLGRGCLIRTCFGKQRSWI